MGKIVEVVLKRFRHTSVHNSIVGKYSPEPTKQRSEGTGNHYSRVFSKRDNLAIASFYSKLYYPDPPEVLNVDKSMYKVKKAVLRPISKEPVYAAMLDQRNNTEKMKNNLSENQEQESSDLNFMISHSNASESSIPEPGSKPESDENLKEYPSLKAVEKAKFLDNFRLGVSAPTINNAENIYLHGIEREELEGFPAELAKTLSLAHANQKQILNFNKMIARIMFCKDIDDTGNTEFKIVALTLKINRILQHLHCDNRKDFQGSTAAKKMMDQRRKLLLRIRAKNLVRFFELIKFLGIRLEDNLTSSPQIQYPHAMIPPWPIKPRK